MNLIDCIWRYTFILWSERFDKRTGIQTRRSIGDADKRHLMTELARKKGCLFEDSFPLIPERPTPLFDAIANGPGQGTTRQFTAFLKQLLDTGYDKEYRNDRGETPLLFAARITTPSSLAGVQLLIAENADVHAVENPGRGALHSCFLDLFCSTVSLVSFYYSCLTPRDERSDKCYCLTRHGLGHESSYYKYSVSPTPKEAYFDDESNDCISSVSCVESVRFKRPLALRKCLWCGESGCGRQGIFWLKLLVLLRAGCDPNTLDNAGLSPSDYARREGLWPEWEWALSESGYVYDEDKDLCERKDETSQPRLEDLQK